MLLKDIKKYSDYRYDGDSTMPQRLEMLQRHRLFVLDKRKMWDDYLHNLDGKIEFYESHILGN